MREQTGNAFENLWSNRVGNEGLYSSWTNPGNLSRVGGKGGGGLPIPGGSTAPVAGGMNTAPVMSGVGPIAPGAGSAVPLAGASALKHALTLKNILGALSMVGSLIKGATGGDSGMGSITMAPGNQNTPTSPGYAAFQQAVNSKLGPWQSGTVGQGVSPGHMAFKAAAAMKLGQPSAAYQAYLQALQERRDARSGTPAVPPQGGASPSAQRRVPAMQAGRSY
jgi:hypothetical protein